MIITNITDYEYVHSVIVIMKIENDLWMFILPAALVAANAIRYCVNFHTVGGGKKLIRAPSVLIVRHATELQ